MNNNYQGSYCEELAELIAACDGDDPDPALLERIDQHIQDCDVCSRAEAALTREVVAFRNCEPNEVSAAFESALVDRLCKPGKRGTAGDDV